MIKVVSIVGTRPETIKMAPVIKELTRYPQRILSRVYVTAQHRQMLDEALKAFDITPDGDLNLMQYNQSPSDVFARVIAGISAVFQAEKPDWVLLQGDTSTVPAAALAAYHEHIKVAHVEAGLRTDDKRNPFPEEINRRIASVIADLHFAPTNEARRNLLKEGVREETVFVTGNPVIDALKFMLTRPLKTAGLPLPPDWSKLILVTAHRRESLGRPLERICLALSDLAKMPIPGIGIVFPVHPNPNVQHTVRRLLENVPNVLLTTPLDYHSLIHLMQRATLVLTDSGGIQEEAPALGKPVLVLRAVTERPEGVKAGTAKLVGTQRATIVQNAVKLLEDPEAYERMARVANPYGDGKAAERIVKVLLGEGAEPFPPAAHV